jgi:2-polyprenyl-3-methyl-5-hydroxy-6-metoxy-1,4-benzoquinol methylase
MIELPDFDALYREDPDPWQVRSSFYEQRKLGIVLACLQRPRYRSVWDPACGVGELAARLVTRSDRVLASDASAEAVRLTRQRAAGLGGLDVRELALPAVPPAPHSGFDLVVLSEFLYYLPAPDRAATLAALDTVTGADAEVVSVHWRHHPHDAWLSGADVESEVVEGLVGLGWRHRVRHDDRDFVVNGLERGR